MTSKRIEKHVTNAVMSVNSVFVHMNQLTHYDGGIDALETAVMLERSVYRESPHVQRFLDSVLNLIRDHVESKINSPLVQT